MPQSPRRLALEAMSVIADGRSELADALVHPDYHDHEQAADRPGGPEAFKEAARVLRCGFSEVRFEPHDLLVDGDRVAVRGQFMARHVGRFAGVPATHRHVSIQEVHIWRVADGRLIEHWAVRDRVEALRQLGVLEIRHADHLPRR